jgi:hypothetical protein
MRKQVRFKVLSPVLINIEVFWATTLDFRGAIIPTSKPQHSVILLVALRIPSLVVKYTNLVLIIK